MLPSSALFIVDSVTFVKGFRHKVARTNVIRANAIRTNVIRANAIRTNVIRANARRQMSTE